MSDIKTEQDYKTAMLSAVKIETAKNGTNAVISAKEYPEVIAHSLGKFFVELEKDKAKTDLEH